jgi:hypothetical protein
MVTLECPLFVALRNENKRRYQPYRVRDGRNQFIVVGDLFLSHSVPPDGLDDVQRRIIYGASGVSDQ